MRKLEKGEGFFNKACIRENHHVEVRESQQDHSSGPSKKIEVNCDVCDYYRVFNFMPNTDCYLVFTDHARDILPN